MSKGIVAGKHAEEIIYSLKKYTDNLILQLMEDIGNEKCREIELRKSSTHIQWRYVDEDKWTNLVAIEDLIGPSGISPNLSIGSVTTLENGSNATAEITGEFPDLILNLGIPRGSNGEDLNIDLSSYATIEYVNSVTFSGDYEDLVNKPTMESFEYSNPQYPDIKNLQDAIDKILYVSPVVTSFTSSVNSTTHEIGTTIKGPITFNWEYNKSIKAQSFNDVTLNNSIRTTTYDSDITSDKTFTISGNDGTNSTSKSISYKFQHKRYFGASLEPVEYNSKFILNLPNNEFCTSRAKQSFSCDMGSEKQYFYYCYPAKFGEAIFNVGGFDGGLEKVTTINLVNGSGYEESFFIYKSENENLGINNIQVR